jgi:hypothetical protein
VSFGFLVAAFVATLNAGRVALAAQERQPAARAVALALAAPAVLVVAAVLLADPILDGLSISPPSFRLGAALVLIATGLRTLVAPAPPDGPFLAILVTPELACLALSFGADEPAGEVLAAAALGLLPAVFARRLSDRGVAGLAARFLAALQLVVAVALGVSGIRDV